MADLGSFMQGFTSTLNAKRDREQRREEMELQKKILTSKLAADTAAQELEKRKLSIILSQFEDMGGGGQPSQPAPGMTAQGIPEMIARETTPALPATPASVAGGTATPGNVPRGTPGQTKIAELMTRPEGQIALHELFGFVPKPQNLTPRTIGAEGGGRVTQFFDESGNPVQGKAYPEPTETVTEEVNIGNQTFYRDLDKYTRRQVGDLRPKQQGVKPLGTTEANTIALTKSSLRDAQRGIDTLFSGGGATEKLFSSWLNVPGTKGREFSQAWDRASKPLMVALTGTGMSEKEAEKILNMSKPQPGDKDSAIKAKIESLVGFMEERLKLMDPTGDYGLVNIELPWKKNMGGGAKKPSLKMGNKGAGKLSPQDEAAAYMRGR